MKKNYFKTLKHQMKDVFECHKGLFILCIIYTLLQGVVPIIGAIFPKYIINGIQNNLELEKLLQYVLILSGGLIIFSSVATYIQHYSWALCLDVRMKQFSKIARFILNVDYPNIEDPDFEDLCDKSSRTLSSDGDGYQGTLEYLFISFATILSMCLYIYIISLLNPLILLFVFLGGAVSILVSKLSKEYSYKQKGERERCLRRATYFRQTTQDFSKAKDIRLYAFKDRLLKAFNLEIFGVVRVLKKIAKRSFGYAFLELIATLLQEGIAYYLLIKALVDGKILLGDFTMYLSAIIGLSGVLKLLANRIGSILEWLSYTKDYYDMVEDKTYITNGEGLKAIQGGTLEIEFRNVSFKYPKTDKYILKNFNFTIKKGEKLAIVGANGAGKSTIVKLITGLFEPTEGEILVNGISMLKFSRNEYYKMFSAVFQEINTFAFNIAENISMDDASQTNYDKVMDCLCRVGLDEKVQSLEKGLDTTMLKIIDEQGVEFSGGQNQKLAIARALYENSNCIILDEPTAALDALAEAEIYQNFNDLVQNKTAIYISHRLASTKFCDRIALFSEEGLEECGTHEELMELKGTYYDMFTLQGKYYQEKESDEHENAI